MEIKNHFGVYGSAFKKGNCYALRKREDLIRIVLIYRVVVKN